MPLGGGASLRTAGTAARVLTLTGDYVQPAGFGLNGIRVLLGGDLLAVSGGFLYASRCRARPSPAGTASSCAATRSTSCAASTPVPRSWSCASARVLAPRRSSEEVLDRDFNVPTTAALVAGDLLVVNGQFNDPSDAPTEVVRIDRP